MSDLTVGVLRETATRERRVALDPASVKQLISAGRAVLVETDAGTTASYPDDLYVAAGAQIATRDDVVAGSGVMAVVRPPDTSLVAALHEGQVLIGLLDPLNHLATVQELRDRHVTLAAFEMLPRTLSRAQATDALSSQSSTAGYWAASWPPRRSAGTWR